MELFSWENVKKEVLNDKISRKVISGEKITMAQIFIAKDAVVRSTIMRTNRSVPFWQVR